MRYFLAKSEPSTYSIADLARDKQTIWDGVYAPAAIHVIQQWKVGDRVLFYHSGDERRIVGLMEVISSPYLNEKDHRRSWVARVRFVREFPEEKKITLATIKSSGKFGDFSLVRQARLSVMVCPLEFVAWLKAQGVLC
jgi:predicted RNA-binding protein with PUA-like domain